MRKRIPDHSLIVEDAKNDIPYRDIAEKYGIAYSTVSRIAKENGVKKYNTTTDYFDPHMSKDEWDAELRREWKKTTSAVLAALKVRGAKYGKGR